MGDNGAAGAEKYALEEMQRAEKRVRFAAVMILVASDAIATDIVNACL